MVLGAVLEAVTGLGYDALVEERLVRPLGLDAALHLRILHVAADMRNGNEHGQMSSGRSARQTTSCFMDAEQ